MRKDGGPLRHGKRRSFGVSLQLCELELIQRETSLAERRLKAARFPKPKTLEDFRFEAQPSINRVLDGEPLRGEYLDRRESVILVGNPGTGKTHLAIVLGMAACQQGGAFFLACDRVDYHAKQYAFRRTLTKNSYSLDNIRPPLLLYWSQSATKAHRRDPLPPLLRRMIVG